MHAWSFANYLHSCLTFAVDSHATIFVPLPVCLRVWHRQVLIIWMENAVNLRLSWTLFIALVYDRFHLRMSCIEPSSSTGVCVGLQFLRLHF